ncbi:MAG TPA: diguanylate cyclase [Atribacteraceae bacterium]|nr:diguanylate cyclase [Atribacteraceae bacterium]
MRKGESFSDILIQALPVFFVAIDVDGKTMMMNEAMRNALGYTVNEVLGKDYLTNFVPQSDRGSLSQIFEKLAGSREPMVNENRVLTRDGRELLVEWHGRPIFTEEGEYDFFYGIGIDITERKRNQRKIAHLNLALRAISNVNQFIVTEKERDRLVQGVCDRLSEAHGYHTAWIGLLNEEKGLITVGQSPSSQESIAPTAHLLRGRLPICAQKALAQPGVQVSAEPHAECAGCSLSGTHRGRGVMAIRLEHAGKVYGMLTASIPADFIFDKEEYELFAEVALDIAFALSNIELEAKRQQAEEALTRKVQELDALNAASQVVNASLDLDQVLGKIVSLAKEAVGADYTSILLVDEKSGTVRSFENFPDVPSIEDRAQEHGLTRLVMGTGQMVIVDEIGEDGTIVPELGAGVPRLVNPHMVGTNIKSVAYLPLTGKAGSIGVLHLRNLRPQAFRGQETLLTTFANQAAIAVENARLYETVSRELTERKRAEEALRKSERRLRTMNRVLAKLSRSMKIKNGDPGAFLKEITEVAARTLEVERASIWLYDEKGIKIQCLDQYELGAGRHAQGFELVQADYPAYFRALEEERAIVADNVLTDPRTRELSESYLFPHGITSILDAPLRLGGRTVGVIAHEHVGPARRWTPDEQNFAGSLADFVSLAMEAQERWQAEEALAESQWKIENLNKITRRLAVCATEDEAYRLTMEAAERILGFLLCFLDIVEGDRMVVKATSSELPPGTAVERSLAEDELAARTYHTGKTIVFGSPDEVPEARPARKDFRSGICAPIGDIGVFQVVATDVGAFTEDDVHRLELLLGQTAEAIKRIRLQNELREQAIRDPLTGVYNRRYFTQTIEQEVSRAVRHKRLIAFLMIDVNRFKEINDRFGHQTGDRVLQAVGRLLAQQVREEDIVVRYGGDEFLIVLPETDGGEVDTVKKRIGTAIARINETSKLIDFPVTLSLGCAYWNPGGSESIEEVLAWADQRMYGEKRKQGSGHRSKP